MQTQINGLNQGVSNANDGVSMIQTASSGLAQITTSLQTIRTLAVQASSGSLSASDQAALQQEVAQQVAEVNRVASQTTYNGKNVLDGSAGNVSFQIGANVGQTISLNLTQSLSAASLGGGVPQAGSTLTSITGVSLTSAGAATAAGVTPAITTVNVLADGNGGFTFTDQNNQALSTTAVGALFTGTTTGTAGSTTALPLVGAGAFLAGVSTAVDASIATANTLNTPPAISAVNVSSTTGANATMEAIDNALATVNNIQATLGAAQNRFTSASSAQQAQSTDLAGAQSQITDANFAQETANLSKAQVLQQAGISVLAQANSLPQQVLKLLQ
jgi:flagellin